MRKPSPALIVAILALIVAMSGTAVAAKKYIITSTTQIKPSVLKKLQGANGINGKNGVNGVNGANGSNGARGWNQVTGPTTVLAPGDVVTVTATCNGGQVAVGGGFYVSINHVAASLATAGGSSWSAILNNDTSISANANAYAICVNAG